MRQKRLSPFLLLGLLGALIVLVLLSGAIDPPVSAQSTGTPIFGRVAASRAHLVLYAHGLGINERQFDDQQAEDVARLLLKWKHAGYITTAHIQPQSCIWSYNPDGSRDCTPDPTFTPATIVLRVWE